MDKKSSINKTDLVQAIKTTKVVYPQIYAYTLPDIKENIGSQKIGYTERKDVDARIREQTSTAAIQIKYEKLWSGSSFFKNSNQDFKDKVFHTFLIKNGIKKRDDLGTEWFFFNGAPNKSKELFDLFKEERFAALQKSDNKIPYQLRFEQENAVNQAKFYFDTHKKGEFLWNAKPRFGKTLASYDLVKRLEAKKVLIVTNRPAIANSWFDDFEIFIDGYYFISDTSSLSERASLTKEQYDSLVEEKPFITFLSLQDLKGSKYFGGNHNKLKWVADLEWDLLIIDEAHEGIDTDRTDAAFDIVKRKYTLHLSGTPFKALANEKFAKEAIFNWTYLDEQEKKREELEAGDESGDHADMPDLRLYTYRISQMTADKVNEGVEIDNSSRDYAFDLNEFFATKNKKLVHEDDVKNFLKNLTTNSKYPFSTLELRDQLRHTFWYVGNRVESIKALEQLLKQDDVFKDYKIIVAAGDGKSFEEEEYDFKNNEKSFDKVKKAIKENDKTITLSCGQLTTGVTIKEWSAVLMLTDIKSTPQYMQAAFRAQNPYKFFENGELKAKQSAYLFDFAPTRVLEMYDTFANGLNPKATTGEITEAERKENIRELLNYFPVISEDVNGKMIELDAEKVLTFPNALAATEIVKAQFMTNLLFNDNVKNVFHFPKEVEDILNKMPNEKNKRAEQSKNKLDLDNVRKVEQAKQFKVNENSNVILGEKIYRSNIDRVVDNALDDKISEENLGTLPDRISAIAEPLIAKYKETYSINKTETDTLRKETEEKIKQTIAEYENAEIKDPQVLKENLKKVIERDFVFEKVGQQEAKNVEEVQKSKEDEVRDHLRAFTRTIPMFIMANSTKETITIDNFDEEVIDEDFVDLANITKKEFHMLRDGFDYKENGENKHFGGVFDKYKFNASIAEFIAEKNRRSDYFNTNEDIFELIPNQKNNQIFTPIKVVKMMIDELENESPELFQRSDSTFIDLHMKSGMYITEITKRLFANTRNKYRSDIACIKHILENQVYGLAPTGILQGITQNYIFGFDDLGQISTKNFKQHNLLPEAMDDTATEKLLELFNKKNTMKFDAVVGNPPYQETASQTEDQTQGNSSWIYYHFQNVADKIANKTCLIYPFGGWFDTPRTFGGFGEKILSDNHTVSIDAYEGTSDKRAWYRNDKSPEPIFGSGVNLSAGIAIVLRDTVNLRDSFTYSNRVYSDVKTSVNVKDWEQLCPNPAFFDTQKKFATHSKLIENVKKGIFGIESNFVEHNPSKVSFSKKDWDNPILLLTNDKSGSSGRTKEFWVDRSIIEKGGEYLDLHKVITTSAYPKKSFTSGGPTVTNAKERVKELIEILPSGSAFGGSRISLFMSKNRSECDNFMKYAQTTFFAGLVLQEPNRRSTIGSIIPNQDFTNDSDIDWSKSVDEIDQQLYKKYKLTKKEIGFIEGKR